MARQQQTPKRQALHVKRGDTVVVLSGKDRGKTGIVKRVYPALSKVLVEGINLKKKAVKPTPMIGVAGGIVEMEFPFPSCKVMVFSAAAKRPTRYRIDVIEQPDGRKKRVRVCRQTNTQLD